MSTTEDMGYGAAMGTLDTAGLVRSLASLGRAVAARPQRLAPALMGAARGQLRVGIDLVVHAVSGTALSDPPNTGGDRRFADRAWSENPVLRSVANSYLAWCDWARSLADTTAGDDLDFATARKARFGLALALDALAPSNVPWINPAVVKEALDTGGASLRSGFMLWLDDLIHNGGRPQQVDRTPFVLGRNLAATPGRVVFRNDLIELIAYDAQTPDVFAQPIVCSPPWINKYYVMDLAPGRSFIEWAVKHGFTVFAISYRNPDASMSALGMDDYLRDGLLAAVEQAREITSSARVNIAALCLGGTLTVLGLAHLAATGRADEIGWATLTNTLVDFSEPGDLGVFTDEATVSSLEAQMRRTGYLDGKAMASTFDWLRGNDLVWNYVVSNWFMGKTPPAFDILSWNADTTRMPATMHAEYLRTCYVANALVEPGAAKLLGTPIDLAQIETPLFVLAAESDHIAPWRSAYRTTQVTGGNARFTLSTSGHVAGIVNPPGNPKAAHWVRDGCPADPDDWLHGADRRAGSWWESWVEWAAERSGPRIEPPVLPDGEPAPGSYVHG